MTERDIQGYVAAFIGAVKSDDEKTALAAGSALVSNLLVDINRIANALESKAQSDHAEMIRRAKVFP